MTALYVILGVIAYLLVGIVVVRLMPWVTGTCHEDTETTGWAVLLWPLMSVVFLMLLPELIGKLALIGTKREGAK